MTGMVGPAGNSKVIRFNGMRWLTAGEVATGLCGVSVALANRVLPITTLSEASAS